VADTKKNYQDYISGKAPLKNAVLFMDDDDKIQDFVKANVRRSLWVMPMKKWQDYQDKLKKNKSDDE